MRLSLFVLLLSPLLSADYPAKDWGEKKMEALKRKIAAECPQIDIERSLGNTTSEKTSLPNQDRAEQPGTR